MPCCLVPQECIVALRHVLINEEADRRDAGMPASRWRSFCWLCWVTPGYAELEIKSVVTKTCRDDACRQGSMCRYLREIYTL